MGTVLRDSRPTRRWTPASPAAWRSAVEFKKREGGGSLSGSWLSTWDSSSGTPGTNTQLTRSESVTVGDGLDAVLLVRVTYKDNLGNTQRKEGTVPVADLKQVTKTVKIAAGQWMGKNESATWAYNGTEFDPNNTTTAQTYYTYVLLPPGVVVTDVDAELYRATTGDAAELAAKYVSGSPGSALPTTLATLTHASTGWVTLTSSVSKTVGADERWYLQLDLESTSATADSRCMATKLTYDAPSYDKTL